MSLFCFTLNLLDKLCSQSYPIIGKHTTPLIKHNTCPRLSCKNYFLQPYMNWIHVYLLHDVLIGRYTFCRGNVSCFPSLLPKAGSGLLPIISYVFIQRRRWPICDFSCKCICVSLYMWYITLTLHMYHTK